ncbi:hypothetical protein OPV09_07070 [Janthinobacterium sp. TB1-E2]|uniref:Uncharacterized protein n=1 Tax=Janthinobacterium aestuarii TaxID=2985511 RepID=A0ABZ2GPW6_9BURK
MDNDALKKILNSDNHHEVALKKILNRNRKWRCLYPCCADKSIFSHAISKSISLAPLVEKGHLQTIVSRRENDIKTLQFGSIGVNDATAFNGFCETHDSLFSILDIEEISNARSLLLQAYRSVISVCSTESRIAELKHASLNEMDITSIIEAHVEEYPWLQEEQGKTFFMTEYAKVVESVSRRANQVMQLPEQLLAKLEIIDEVPLDGFSVVSTEQLSHHIVFRRLGFRIPAALNTVLSIVEGGDMALDFFFTVIPYEQSTLVMGIAPKESKQWLLDRLMQGFSSDIAALNLVESIMSCSNDWYMTPSVLVEMPTEKRDVFLHDSTFINEQRFYEDYDMTLFDSLRRSIAQQYPEQKAELKLDKIGMIPQRESYDIRQKRMMDALVSQTAKLRDL